MACGSEYSLKSLDTLTPPVPTIMVGTEHYEN